MKDLIRQVRAAADSNAYYLCLFAALAIPDICAALESKDGLAHKDSYVAWFNRYVAPRYVVGPDRKPSFIGEDAYYFRCSMLHQGSSQHPKSTYKRILFIEPGVFPGILMHNNVMNDALNIDVARFCHDILDGAEQWLSNVENDPTYQANSARGLRRFPTGLPPYIDGMPVIA